MFPRESSSSEDAATRTKQHTTSRMMKTTKRGRPFAKDTHDLFATLVVSLNLTTHRQYFKTYSHSFTTDEAAENLSALKFSQSNRVPDPNEPSRVVTTTTTTTFSMNREMAKGICQHFMDARLIENAGDIANGVFKDKGVYVLTPKGLHVLERFITKNGINGEHLTKVFAAQPICMKLLHLERRIQDDEPLVNGPVLEVIFRRFAGREPNYNLEGTVPRSGEAAEAFDRTQGVEVQNIQEKIKGQGQKTFKHTFNAMTVLDWLCDFTTVCGKDEAAEISAHFVRLGFISLITDKSKKEREPWDDRDIVVRVEDGRGAFTEGHFRCHYKTVYGITDRGRIIARWDQTATGFASPLRASESTSKVSIDGRETMTDRSASPNLDRSTRSHDANGGDVQANPSTPASQDSQRLNRKASTTERMRPLGQPGSNAPPIGQGIVDTSSYNSRDSNTNRLKNVLDEPALRSLFREFLKQNFCEENLSFWLDVQEFKRRFHTTSSAVAVRGFASPTEGATTSVKSGMGRKLGRSITEAFQAVGGGDTRERAGPAIHGFAAMERHQQDLIGMAFVIYNTYLAPASPSELNIEHNLRAELVAYMNRILSEAKVMGLGTLSPSSSSTALSSSESEDLASSFVNEEKKSPPPAHRMRIPLHASQLQTLVRLYERIQDHIFRLMATDSVPRFIKDARFLQLVKSVEEYTEALEAGRIDPCESAGPAIGREVVEAMELRLFDMGKSSSQDATASGKNSIALPKIEPGLARLF